MQSREAVELDIARSTIARLEPLIVDRIATPRQKHAYWDALDVVRHYQDMVERADPGTTMTLSHTMPNPLNLAELGKLIFAIGGVIILLVVIVCVGAIAAGSLS